MEEAVVIKTKNERSRRKKSKGACKKRQIGRLRCRDNKWK